MNMYNPQDDVRRAVLVRDRFPSGHIQAFGLATVGQVYITFNSQGKVVLAAASLQDAPFKRMIIDDLEILRIFWESGDKIEIDVLHPWPRSRLDPIEPALLSGEDAKLEQFDVGRLVDITNKPSASRFGLALHNLSTIDPSEEGAVHKSVRKTVEAANFATQRNNMSTKNLSPFVVLTLNLKKADKFATSHNQQGFL